MIYLIMQEVNDAAISFPIVTFTNKDQAQLMCDRLNHHKHSTENHVVIHRVVEVQLIEDIKK